MGSPPPSPHQRDGSCQASPCSSPPPGSRPCCSGSKARSVSHQLKQPEGAAQGGSMRLIMDRWDTPASISNIDGKRRGIRVMYGPTSSRGDSRKEDLVTQESINQQTQHLTMTTSTCRGWTPCR